MLWQLRRAALAALTIANEGVFSETRPCVLEFYPRFVS